MLSHLGKCCAVLWLCQAVLAQAPERTYVAAVYEHSVVLNPRPREPLGRRAALAHMQQNLDMLEKQAAAAAGQVRHLGYVGYGAFYEKRKKSYEVGVLQC